MMRFLAVKNWSTFQHYRDRRPPWIKLYVTLLDDLAFEQMGDADQIGLVRIWLLAARLGHPLPNDPQLIYRRARVRPATLARLISSGWLEERTGASADAINDASAEDSALTRAPARSREGEGESERDTTTTAARTWHRHFVDGTREVAAAVAFESEHRDPAGFDEALRGLAEPLGGNGFGWAIVGRALVEMRANGVAWHARRCFRYCEQLKAGDAPARTNGHGATKQSRNLAAIEEGLRQLKAQEAVRGVA